MNAFLKAFEKYEVKSEILKREKLTTLQVNMGDLCNQSCQHCHIEATPYGKNIMPKKVVDDILAFLKNNKIKILDITGGAPELNPHFDYFVNSARPLVDELIVRSNLTVFFEPGKERLPEFFKANRVHLICSMPCYTKENVDRQRGKGVFEKSIRALVLLNNIGFAKEKGLVLDLVYNPLGAYLPASQAALENEYKTVLKKNYDVEFDRLLTITNVAIKKFKAYLETNNECEKYFNILESNFNPVTLGSLMCRNFLSVGFDGKVYDCDFNLALGMVLKDEGQNLITIDRVRPEVLEERAILTGEHCLACTAGSGSSCQGALTSVDTCAFMVKEDKKEYVRQYYGKILGNKNDLKSNACCLTDSLPVYLKAVVDNIEPEILDKFYGCGSPIPPLLEGCNILDLGCGTGRDVYIASALAGENGSSIGVDMTDEQLEVARKYKDAQMKRFGFKKCNVDFKKGYIEDLKEAGIEDNSQDAVISNCVINLSPDKKSVFSEIFRVLKPGGELYFSDVFADRRIPEAVKNNPLLYAECLGGALYLEDFRRMLKEIGCPDYRIISKRKIEITQAQLKEKVGLVNFYSVTVRAFKLDDLEDICEDYGQMAVYLGTIPYNTHQFVLDDHHVFITHKPIAVCGNTASMLQNTRLRVHFNVVGDKSRHFGPFLCETTPRQSESKYSNKSCC